MTKLQLVDDLPPTLLRMPPPFTCSGCAIGKKSAAPFRRATRQISIGTHLHTDICGPIPTPSLEDNKYFITFLDEGSRYQNIHCAPTKSEAAAFIKEHITITNHITPHPNEHFTSDNAKEFYSKSLTAVYDQHHIVTNPTIPHTPQENSLAERINRTIMNTARATLLSSNLPLELWDYAVLAAASGC